MIEYILESFFYLGDDVNSNNMLGLKHRREVVVGIQNFLRNGVAPGDAHF